MIIFSFLIYLILFFVFLNLFIDTTLFMHLKFILEIMRSVTYRNFIKHVFYRSLNLKRTLGLVAWEYINTWDAVKRFDISIFKKIIHESSIFRKKIIIILMFYIPVCTLPPRDVIMNGRDLVKIMMNGQEFDDKWSRFS